tara:strand:+ start:11925 stop:12233 length:309 start_codon:yes stop_codon:yes gene_type:complete
MISFTDKAIKRLETVLEADEVIRVAVQGGGCSGMSYALVIENEVDEEDLKIQHESIIIYVDPYSAEILTDTVIDFVSTLQKEGFVFNNPKANTTCGCGSSFS